MDLSISEIKGRWFISTISIVDIKSINELSISGVWGKCTDPLEAAKATLSPLSNTSSYGDL